MRISDWSSDVCSSDLIIAQCILSNTRVIVTLLNDGKIAIHALLIYAYVVAGIFRRSNEKLSLTNGRIVVRASLSDASGVIVADLRYGAVGTAKRTKRSEEHTSELQ